MGSPDKISRVTDLLHALFPVRETPQELLDFVRTAIASVVPENAADIESVVESIAWLDDNDDKHIQREEAREHYNIAAKVPRHRDGGQADGSVDGHARRFQRRRRKNSGHDGRVVDGFVGSTGSFVQH